MNFYEIVIQPTSGLGTPLKGDTLFGQFCWQVAYSPHLIDGGLDAALDKYLETPFAVFSSAFPKLVDGYALKRPDIPGTCLFKKESNRKHAYEKHKENKRKKWIFADQKLRVQVNQDSLRDCGLIQKNVRQSHNTINRLTQTTGTGGQFSPFVTENTYYKPCTVLSIFVCIDPQFTDIVRIRKGLKMIGRFGFGRDASTGMGRFEIIEHFQHEWTVKDDDNACLMLAPSVPSKIDGTVYFSPFVRFGKHGDYLVHDGNPFKNPIIMADEGAVYYTPNDRGIFDRPYAGKGIRGKSKARASFSIYTQGFAPYLPFKLEKANAT